MPHRLSLITGYVFRKTSDVMPYEVCGVGAKLQDRWRKGVIRHKVLRIHEAII
jgi:hypothetical protein